MKIGKTKKRDALYQFNEITRYQLQLCVFRLNIPGTTSLGDTWACHKLNHISEAIKFFDIMKLEFARILTSLHICIGPES